MQTSRIFVRPPAGAAVVSRECVGQLVTALAVWGAASQMLWWVVGAEPAVDGEPAVTPLLAFSLGVGFAAAALALFLLATVRVLLDPTRLRPSVAALSLVTVPVMASVAASLASGDGPAAPIFLRAGMVVVPLLLLAFAGVVAATRLYGLCRIPLRRPTRERAPSRTRPPSFAEAAPASAR